MEDEEEGREREVEVVLVIKVKYLDLSNMNEPRDWLWDDALTEGFGDEHNKFTIQSVEQREIFMTTVINRFSGEYSFLSNFFPAPVILAGIKYRSVEHAYQAAKTLDPKKRVEIRTAYTARDAKRLGRDPELDLRPDWETIKLHIMKGLLLQKFSDPAMMQMLAETEDAELIEGNDWHDIFWGKDNKTGRGYNYLGILLMQVRNELCIK